jgi:Tol biopolymer transport system component
VKVLDFGLAKAMDAGPASAAGAPRSDAATITSPAPFDWRSGRPEHSRGAVTQMGMILGTAAYMAPEQAKGRAVDKRADIWAFGVVLCEMITGRRLFEAEDVSETLAAVLTRDVGEAALPADIPPRIRALIASCLVRDPRQRLRDIGDARIALDRLIAGAPEEAAAAAGVAAPPARSPGRLVWPAIAIVSLAAAAGLALTWRSDPAPAPAPVRFAVTPPDGVALEEATPRISPDGRKLAFVATHDSDSRIWVHDFETAVAAPLESTRDLRPGAWGWSPDSRSIMFSTSDTIRRADIAGGPSRAIATAMSSAGDWSLRGVILFAAGRDGGPIQQVSENGGEPAPVTALDATMQEFAHRAPHLLPGGRHFTFLAVDPLTRTRAAYVGTLGSAERRPLPGITSEAKYSPTGHLLFLREGALMAQPFDLERLELGGTPVVVLEDAAPPAALGAPFSVSSTGTFVHRAGSSRVSQLTWFDRSGARLGTVGPPGAYADIEISRDERYVVYEAGPPPGDIWVLDTKTGIAERATSGPSREADPVWSPDGRRIAFRSDGAGGRLHVQTFGGVAGDTLLHESEERESPGSWSADGKFLAYHSRAGIFALPLSGDPTPIRVTDAAVNAEEPQISPDGRWIAYESRELGQLDVFVQSFPVPTVKRRVSIAGGRNPRWRHDSRELYYLAFDLTMMGVTIDDAGGTLSTGAPVALFEVPIASPREGEYTVSASGRFLINVPSGDPRDRPIWVDLHWRPPGR